MGNMEIDVEKLSMLARIEEPEKESIAKDLASIVSYIDQINEVVVNKAERTVPELRNVMREDGTPNQTGAQTAKLLAEMPESKDGFLKVKQIL